MQTDLVVRRLMAMGAPKDSWRLKSSLNIEQVLELIEPFL